jgi:hypothetical protein
MDLYVINLKNRTDRWESIQKHFMRFNIIRIEAIKHEIGMIGCFLSHQKCIKFAKDSNMDYICVLEDDCIPFGDIDIYDKLLLVKEYLDTKNDWNLFVGGGTGIWDGHIVKKLNYDKLDLFEVFKIKTAHMIFYHRSVYEFFLSIDPFTSSVPIDKIWHYIYHAIIPIPFIATQSNGFSDIEGKELAVNDKIKLFNNFLVKLK